MRQTGLGSALGLGLGLELGLGLFHFQVPDTPFTSGKMISHCLEPSKVTDLVYQFVAEAIHSFFDADKT